MIPPHRDLITESRHTMGVAAKAESTTTKWGKWSLLCCDSLVVEEDEVVKTTKCHFPTLCDLGFGRHEGSPQ